MPNKRLALVILACATLYSIATLTSGCGGGTETGTSSSTPSPTSTAHTGTGTQTSTGSATSTASGTATSTSTGTSTTGTGTGTATNTNTGTGTGTGTATGTGSSTGTGSFNGVKCELYPSSAPSGSVDYYDKTDGLMTVRQVYGDILSFGFTKFNTSAVNVTKIDCIVLHYYVETVRQDTNGNSYRIYRYMVDPDTATREQLYDNVVDLQTTAASISTFDQVDVEGWYEVQLNNYYLSDLIDDIQNRGYLALKFYIC